MNNYTPSDKRISINKKTGLINEKTKPKNAL